MAELVGEPGDRLLHWDLHDGNVLAGEREPWLAIDPEPLAGDPVGAVLRRFDLLTEALGLDRQRAAGWTFGRVLQNAIWDVEDGRTALEPAQVTIAAVLWEHRSSA